MQIRGKENAILPHSQKDWTFTDEFRKTARDGAVMNKVRRLFLFGGLFPSDDLILDEAFQQIEVLIA